jgi:hypothetical protein
MKEITFIIAIAASLCGCNTLPPSPSSPDEYDAQERAMRDEMAQTEKEMERYRPENIAAEAKRRREDYVNAHPELESWLRDAILTGKIKIGMTAEQVEASCGKPPGGVNTTVTAYGKSEQWVYENDYLYFVNGILTSYQKFQ